jgi:hypothetical protein
MLAKVGIGLIFIWIGGYILTTQYWFSGVARSERYYVATLLSHCLMANDFEGLKELFIKVLGSNACSNLSNDSEIVSELEPLRDGSVYNTHVKELYLKYKRIAVPDLFLRWDNQCIILAAKFFTDPENDALLEQIRGQQDAIDKVKKFTLYKDMSFYHVA